LAKAIRSVLAWVMLGADVVDYYKVIANQVLNNPVTTVLHFVCYFRPRYKRRRGGVVPGFSGTDIKRRK
jgi:hypothetical protein